MRLMNVAKTPPKGWNSWDCYGASVTEKEVLANAEYMAKHLKDFGWEYVVVDIQWYESAAKSSIYNAFYPLKMDKFSRLMPAVNRFVSAKGSKGFKPLGDRIHALGLKFGIHIMRGIPRQAVHQNTSILGTSKTARDIVHTNSICPWNTDMYGVDSNKEGAQEYYNSLFNLYASWGVDYIKVDDIAASRLYGTHQPEIELIRKAIDQCGRDMVLSLSPGPAPLECADFFKQNANMWRVTDDFWDKWDYIYNMFERCASWAEFVAPHNWPDCDMLPLGRIGIRSVDGNWPNPWGEEGADRYTRLTKDEQMTMMTLWSIFRSPLMFGGELRDNDEWTLNLLTNSELTEMHYNIKKSWQESRNKNFVVWRAESDTADYIALFNISDKSKTITYQSNGAMFDVWKNTMIDINEFTIPSHGVILLKVIKE